MAKKKVKKVKMKLKKEVTLSDVALAGLETVGIVKKLDEKVEQQIGLLRERIMQLRDLQIKTEQRIDRIVRALDHSKSVRGL